MKRRINFDGNTEYEELSAFGRFRVNDPKQVPARLKQLKKEADKYVAALLKVVMIEREMGQTIGVLKTLAFHQGEDFHKVSPAISQFEEHLVENGVYENLQAARKFASSWDLEIGWLPVANVKRR